MRNVSKDIFLDSIICSSLGWLERNDKFIKTTTLGDKLRMEQGLEIGKRARELYPNGILINNKDMNSAIEKTKNLMENPDVKIILEATFSIDGFVTKADILKKENNGWHMIEVKSSVNDKNEFIDDMAYTIMVIKRSGYDVSKISIMLVSKDFRLGMGNDKLFVEIDHTDEVKERVRLFEPFWEQIEEKTRMPEKPEPNLRFECRKCELFKDCLGKNITWQSTKGFLKTPLSSMTEAHR